MASTPVTELAYEIITVSLPHGPTADADENTKVRHAKNVDLVKAGKASLKEVSLKVKDDTTKRVFASDIKVFQYANLDAFVEAYGKETALKLANSAAESRQRSGYMAQLKAKAEGPEKAAARGLTGLANAGVDVDTILEAMEAINPEQAAMLRKVWNK